MTPTPDRPIAAQAEYQPHIDGLRAIAVLSVVLYHFGTPGISAGFLGVDVFFVISGFLIVRLIRAEVLATGGFRYGRFLMRRVRRLFPALAATMVLSAVAAFVVLSPAHFERFGQEMIVATLSVSNFYFESEADYFDIAAEFKPLLHTWSLSVEEQYYLVAPLIVVAAVRWRRGALPVITAVLALVSLVLAQAVAPDSLSFYLTPFRVFEFGIGALLIWVVERWPAGPRLSEPLLVAGLVLIGLSVHLLSAGSTLPGLLTLPVALGTALVLYAGAAPATGVLLRNPLSVWFGRISYALYLVHWPVFVFANYAGGGSLDAATRAVLVVLSIGLATLLHGLVEQRWRYPVPQAGGGNRPFLLRSAALATVLVVAGAAISLGKGWSFRLSPEAAHLLASADRKVTIEGPCRYDVSGITDDLQARLDGCAANAGKAVLIFGDSHGEDLFNALAVNAGRSHVAGITQPSCRPVPADSKCFFPTLGPFLERNKDKIAGLVYTQKGSYFLADYRDLPVDREKITQTLDYLEGIAIAGLPLVWVGPQAEPNFDVDRFTAMLPIGRRDDYTRDLNPAIGDVDRAIAEIVAERGASVDYVSKLGTLGPITAETFVIDGEYTYSDRDHWSAKGEEVFGRELIDGSPTLRGLLD